MPIQAVLAAKDTPLGVRKALLERHQVLKCRVRTTSSLIGQTAFDVGFREKYKAAIIAVQRGGEDMRAANQGRLAGLKFEAGDILMLHCLDKCPLLQFKEPALNVTPSMLALQRDQSREVLNGGSDSARSSIDYGARPDAGGATVVLSFSFSYKHSFRVTDINPHEVALLEVEVLTTPVLATPIKLRPCKSNGTALRWR